MTVKEINTINLDDYKDFEIRKEETCNKDTEYTQYYLFGCLKSGEWKKLKFLKETEINFF